ncbi:MAG TPA: decarboxylating 6-phosphogluconate dehydrogenase [Ignavibacteria bacterium]|nr:decarboxylating 6-phosphogluconate dehydrogenase [Ignavibacteria bacterium]
MKLGLIGLGKMGGFMIERLMKDGHEVVVFDLSKEAVSKAAENGAIPSESLEDLVSKLSERKIVWLMVPSGKPVDMTIDTLQTLLKANDIIIDGGNSFWKDSQARAERLKANNIHYLDCGVSGGVWGLQNGYSLMSGGEKEPSEYVYPIYETLAPKDGYTYCGKSGSGHFVKMVHNGIEYGMMQSYAEGLEILEKSPFDLDLKSVANGWRFGSVIQSWLLDLIVNELSADPKLEKIEGYVPDSGEGRWTAQAAIEFGVPAHVITSSLYNRFQSQQDDSFAMKVLAALRNQFGGHAVKTKAGN